MGKSVKIPSVLGVGNALVDVISVLENDDVLAEFKLPKGSMTLVDAELSKKIYDATYFKNREISTGGSVANTIRTLANLGGKGGYMGKIGRDKLGSIFKDEFEKLQIATHLFYGKKDTGRVMGLVSPDSERTMATYLGAAADLQAKDFTPELFNDYHYFYMEGYLVQNHELIETGVRLAKKQGLKVAIDLASFNIVEANLAFLKNIIEKYVDIVFANEEEAKAFTGLEPESALVEISKICELAIVKVGKEGSLIKKGFESLKVNSIEANALDTTGAGDSYAAGFFYGLTNNFDLQKCGKIAAYVSGKVVEVMGANLPVNQWPEVKLAIKRITD
jgi:sugar/nucleoside kinase (ribokinase family)